MEKRVLLAAFLSLLVLLLWSFLFPTPKTPAVARPVPVAVGGEALDPAPATPPARVPATSASSAPAPATSAAAVAQPRLEAEAEEAVTLSNDRAHVVFSNRGASIRALELPGYKSDGGGPLDMVGGEAERIPLALVLASDEANRWLADALHTVEKVSPSEVRFEVSDGKGLRSIRSYRLEADGSIAFSGELTGGGTAVLAVGPGARPLSADEAKNRFTATGAVIRAGGKSERLLAEKQKEPIPVAAGADFVALDDAYFVAAATSGPKASFRLEPVSLKLAVDPKGGKGPTEHRELRILLEPGGSTYSGRLIFSPKELTRLRGYGIGLEETVDFGWFGFLAKAFLAALRWIHGWSGNWGIAIILLTIVIRVVLFGLTFKSVLAMKRMQLLGPQMEAIKEKYRKKKGDPESRNKMNQEMMALYQKEGVNPASGCLPLLFQLPIFIGFYNLLAHAIELRQAPFALWIHDLSIKDPYFVIPTLMGAAWFVQTLITPSTADPVQKKIFLAMPVVFTVMMMSFPSGLTLYWLVSNLLSIAQQVIINRMDTPAPRPQTGE